MNIVLTIHPGTPEAFSVELFADSEDAPAMIDADDDGFAAEITAASGYLSGLDGKLRTPGRDATVADLATIIGKYVAGDMEVAAGRLPPGLLDDPMTGLNEQDDAEDDA